MDTHIKFLGNLCGSIALAAKHNIVKMLCLGREKLILSCKSLLLLFKPVNGGLCN